MGNRLQRKSFLAVLLAMVLAFGIAGFTVLLAGLNAAADDSGTWDGDLIAAGWDGNGEPASATDYVKEEVDGDTKILIYSGAGLAYFAHEVYADTAHELDGMTVELRNDIDLGGHMWIPIGQTNGTDSPEYRFSGIFNGNGFTISGLSTKNLFDNLKYEENKFENTDYYVEYTKDEGAKVDIPFGVADGGSGVKEYSYGLFGVASNVTVKNLKVIGVDISAEEVTPDGGTETLKPNGIGSIIGYGVGNVILQGCTAGSRNMGETNKISVTATNNGAYGGLVGSIYAYGDDTAAENYQSVEISNCKNYVDIEYNGTSSEIGGIVGYMTAVSKADIESCVNYGNITGGTNVGGMTGSWSNPNEDTDYELNIINCDNYGNIDSHIDNYGEFGDDRNVGGIIGKVYGNGENTGSAVVTVVIDGCTNYGNATGNKQVGGIIAALQTVPGFDAQITGNYNYGAVYAYGDSTGSNSASAAGGYIGSLSAVNPDEGTNPTKLTISGGNLGRVYGAATAIGSIFGSKNLTFGTSANLNELFYVDAGSSEKAEASAMQGVAVPTAHPTYERERYTQDITSDGTFKYTDAGRTIIGFADGVQASATLTIPVVVSKIGYAAFAGQTAITNVEFLGNVTEIGDLAFAGTSLTELELPSRLTAIGSGAFAGKQLKDGADTVTMEFTNVALPSSLTQIGQAAFANCTSLNHVTLSQNAGNIVLGTGVFNGTRESKGGVREGAFIIATGNAQYRQLLANSNFENSSGILTYVVTINYLYDNKPVGTAEQRLSGQSYKVALNDGKWEEGEFTSVGPTDKEYVWYDSIERKNKTSTIEEVTALLASANSDTVTLYAFSSTFGQKVFIARTGIIYDGTEYTVKDLNSLLHTSSDLITSSMTVTISQYVADGAKYPTAPVPTSIRNAGEYTIKVVDGGSQYTFTIVIERATLDLADLANLQWYIAKIGNEGTSASLLGENVLLYIYTYGNNADADKRGKEYPSLQVLDSTQIANLKLNSSYEMRTVSYSALRNRGNEVTVEINNHGYYTAQYDGNTGTDVGVYNAQATLTATVNYKFVVGSISSLRGLTIEVSGSNPTTATVTKKWYIVDLSNWLVAAGSKTEYTVSDHTFNTNPTFSAPETYYKDQNGNSAEITMHLSIWNGDRYVPVGGEAGFGVDKFADYINSVMPAGNYRLVINVAGVTAVDEDDRTNVYRTGFSETFGFTVEKASLSEIGVVGNVINALNGHTFTSDIAGGEIYDGSAKEAVDELLKPYNIDRGTTVWAGSAYESYYGGYSITYNLVRLYNDKYSDIEDIEKYINKPDTYTVYYRISAPNYYDSTEEGTRYDYYFTLIKYQVVNVPDVSGNNKDLTYTGNRVLPTVAESGFYEIIWDENDAYIAGGMHKVTFRLYDPVVYRWAGNENRDDVTDAEASFEIKQAVNVFTLSLNMLGWSYDTFDAATNNIRAAVKYLDEGKNIHFKVTKSGETAAVTGLGDFTIDANGKVSESIAKLLNALSTGTYTLYASVDETGNYSGITSYVDFAVSKAMNSWANGDEDLVIPSWVVGEYSAGAYPIVVNAEHGSVNIIITDIDGNEYYNSVTGVNKLSSCKAGKYLLKAWVDETDNYAALAERTFTIQIFDKAGLPWWAALLIAVGVLAIAALVIFILWKRGVFQILTEKLVVSIRTRATIDATMAAVRAAKLAEEGRLSIEDAKRRERLEKMNQKEQEERASADGEDANKTPGTPSEK